MSEEIENRRSGMERREMCESGNGCVDMIRVNTMLKIFLSGVAVLLLSAMISVFFQWRGAAAQVQTSGTVLELKDSFDELSTSVRMLFSRVDKIERNQDLQSFDGQVTRHHMNKIGKKLGIDPIELRPFHPPTYEEMVKEYKKQNGIK